jgi:hypothetical protein
VKAVVCLLCATIAVAGCDGSHGVTDSGPQQTAETGAKPMRLGPEPGSIALMALPRAELGDAFADFYLDRDCGPVDNKFRLDDLFDAYASEDALENAGRIQGYRLAYANPDFAAIDKPGGTTRVASTIDEFETATDASAFLADVTRAIEELDGTRPDRDVIVGAVRVSSLPYGSEGRLVRMTLEDDNRRHRAVIETASFRVGTLVASVERTTVDGPPAGDVNALAERLAERVAGVRSGAITSTEGVAVSFEVQHVDYTQHGTARVTYLDPERGSVTETVQLPWESDRFILQRGTNVRVDATDGADLVCSVDLGQGPYGRTSSGPCPFVLQL